MVDERILLAMAVCLKGKGLQEDAQKLSAAEVFNRWTAIGGLLFFVGFTLWVTPEKMSIVSCPFKAWTGLNCPACGLTHSLSAIAQWQWRQAFQYHFFGPLFIVGAWGLLLVWLGELLSGRKVTPTVSAACWRRGLAALLGIWFFYWLWRMNPAVI
jgi:hypothetical protein